VENTLKKISTKLHSNQAKVEGDKLYKRDMDLIKSGGKIEQETFENYLKAIELDPNNECAHSNLIAL